MNEMPGTLRKTIVNDRDLVATMVPIIIIKFNNIAYV